uniref:uncharacterized protein LOC101312574 n=1 Tax=Fragaria vesca subsp. vesca TaxID=101020 RepID=UPI0005C857DC|nr:PREDICTED: uncharacterized protein LOC101312574 [Fragaria vesca subsp. vesca]
MGINTEENRWSRPGRGKMIKRRFYRMEHGDRDGASNQSSSSSSDSEIQVHSEAEAEDVSSGYKTEDSSANETLVDTSASGFPIDDGNEGDSPKHDLVFGRSDSEFQEQGSNISADKESPSADLPEYVVKRKSTFKCRICPRIVCLNEEALSAHLKSKRHARSEKLLNEGRLKAVLNSDGKLDEEDTPALYARILASPQAFPRKRSKQEDKRRPRKKRMR